MIHVIHDHRKLLKGASGQRICFLVRLPAFFGELDRSELMLFQDLLPIVLSAKGTAEVRYYFDNFRAGNGKGLIYPYYMIGKQGILLIDRSLSDAILLNDLSLADLWRKKFDASYAESENLMEARPTLEALHQVISEQETDVRAYFSPYPCMAMLATEEYVRRFIPEEEQESMWKYCRWIQSNAGINIFSPKALLKMKEDHGYVEAGVKVNISDDEMNEFLMIIREELGKRFFLADPDGLFVPESWNVNVIGDSAVLIYGSSYYEGKLLMIKEKNLVSALTRAVTKTLMYFTIDAEESKKFLDQCIKINGKA